MLNANEIEARVRDSFARRSIMTTLGAEIAAVRSGEVEIVLPFSDRILQQHEFIHAGAVATIADSACGYAALSVMPRDAAVLATESKSTCWRRPKASGCVPSAASCAAARSW